MKWHYICTDSIRSRRPHIHTGDFAVVTRDRTVTVSHHRGHRCFLKIKVLRKLSHISWVSLLTPSGFLASLLSVKFVSLPRPVCAEATSCFQFLWRICVKLSGSRRDVAPQTTGRQDPGPSDRGSGGTRPTRDSLLLRWTAVTVSLLANCVSNFWHRNFVGSRCLAGVRLSN